MLQRVIAIRNIGRFRNSAASPLPDFARRTLVFAANSHGKSTFCAILRSHERADPAIVQGRRALGAADPPSVDVLWDGQRRSFVDGSWTCPEPKLSIYDGVFVTENVFAGEHPDLDNRRNLYRVIVGRGGVALAHEEARLADEGRRVQSALSAAERAIEQVSGGAAPQAFADLVPVDGLEGLIAARRRTLEALKEAASVRSHAPLSEAPLPAWDSEVEGVLERTLSGVGAEAEALVAGHLAQHAMQDGGQRWLAAGVAYETGVDCPFCGRDGLEGLALVQAYRTLFSDAYAGLKAQVDRAAGRADAVLGDRPVAALTTLQARNEAGVEFWRRYCDVSGEALPDLGGPARLLTQAHGRLSGLLRQKAAALFEPTSEGLDEARAVVLAAAVQVTAYNDAVRIINAAIAAKQADTAAGDISATQAELARLLAVERRFSAAGVAAVDEWRAQDRAKREVNRRKADVRRDLEAHCRGVVAPYQARINHYLDLFQAGFSIVNTAHAYPGGVATCNYQLSINEVAVGLGDSKTPLGNASFRNTLSAGDRSTLALAFFLADLEREPDLAERVVVFDDPFNSQDAFRRRQTIFEIADLAGKARQVIVLSHDPAFLKQLWDKSPSAERQALQFLHHPSVGSKIMAFDLEEASRGRARQELDDLILFHRSGAGDLRDVIKKVRIVLETYLRSSFPGHFGAAVNLGGILAEIRGEGDGHPAHPLYGDLDRINDYTADYHHGEDPAGRSEPPLDRDELAGFVAQTLRLVNAVPA